MVVVVLYILFHFATERRGPDSKNRRIPPHSTISPHPDAAMAHGQGSSEANGGTNQSTAHSLTHSLTGALPAYEPRNRGGREEGSGRGLPWASTDGANGGHGRG